MLIGYMRVSKADGSQTLDLQKDALLSAGVEAGHIYEDRASGKTDARPGLKALSRALREGNTLLAFVCLHEMSNEKFFDPTDGGGI